MFKHQALLDSTNDSLLAFVVAMHRQRIEVDMKHESRIDEDVIDLLAKHIDRHAVDGFASLSCARFDMFVKLGK